MYILYCIYTLYMIFFFLYCLVCPLLYILYVCLKSLICILYIYSSFMYINYKVHLFSSVHLSHIELGLLISQVVCSQCLLVRAMGQAVQPLPQSNLSCVFLICADTSFKSAFSPGLVPSSTSYTVLTLVPHSPY